jgi:hypothetical protein
MDTSGRLRGVAFSCLAVATVACSTRAQDQTGTGGVAGTMGGQGGGGTGGLTPCPAAEPIPGDTCQGNWGGCVYRTDTCCGHVYPHDIYACNGIVSRQYHELQDCSGGPGSAAMCVDGGGYDAAAADPQTPACVPTYPSFTPCDSSGHACRSGGSQICICQPATSPDGSAAPFWYCQ